MNKRILAASFALLMVAVLVSACGNKKDFESDPTYEPIEYTTNDDGDKFVTNIYGDLIPITTGKDGSVELMEDLATKTADQVEQDKIQQEKEDEAANNGGNNGGNNNGGNNNGGNNGGNSGDTDGEQSGIRVGNDDVQSDGNEAVIVW